MQIIKLNNFLRKLNNFLRRKVQPITFTLVMNNKDNMKKVAEIHFRINFHSQFYASSTVNKIAINKMANKKFESFKNQ